MALGARRCRRIYQTQFALILSLTVNGPMTRADRVATLEEAKAKFQKSWDAWKAWVKLEGGALSQYGQNNI